MSNQDKIRNLTDDSQFKKWFEDVYENYFERLFRYAFSITKDQQLAEDVVSEVFTNIWLNHPNYSNINELSSYLHVSVKHLAIRLVSKDPGRFSYTTYDETLQISDSVDPESLLLTKELTELINDIINSLSPHAKVVYDLARNKGYTYQEIADELGISKRTVESHMHNVLKKMKEGLQAHFKESNYPYFTNIGAVVGVIAGTMLGLY